MEAPRTRHWARRPRWLTRSSPIQISPASGGSSSPIRLRSVDLPEPDVPETATSSPPLTSRSTPWSTGTGVPPGPVKVLRSPLAFSTTTEFRYPAGWLRRVRAARCEGWRTRRRARPARPRRRRQMQQTRRKEEELLSLADDPRIDGGADAEGQEHAHHAA